MLRFLFQVWLWLKAEIVFGFLIATVFWTAVLGWQAAYAPTVAEKQKCYDAADKSGHKTEECKSIWERTTSDPVAFFTFWLVISTVGLGASTLLLWFAGERQLRHARRSAAIQSRDMRSSIAVAEEANQLNRENFAASQRPWIEILAVDPIGPFSCNGQTASLQLSVKIKNIGPSPAFIVFPFTSGYHAGPGTNMLDLYERFAADVRKNSLGERIYGGILYPNRERVLTGMTVSPVWHSQQLEEARTQRSGDDRNSFNPAIIVDIDYTSTHRTSHYQTALILSVLRLNPNQPGYILFNPDGFEFQQGGFELSLHPLGHYAD